MKTLLTLNDWTSTNAFIFPLQIKLLYKLTQKLKTLSNKLWDGAISSAFTVMQTDMSERVFA